MQFRHLFRSKTFTRIILPFLAISSLLFLFYLKDTYIFRTMDLSDYTQAGINNKDFFYAHRPTYNEIEEYLDDMTIYYHTEHKDYVIYTDHQHRIFLWDGSEIHKGHWTSEFRIQPVVYQKHWRFIKEQLFCEWYPVEDFGDGDNCTAAFDLKTLFNFRYVINKVPGDPLGLHL